MGPGTEYSSLSREVSLRVAVLRSPVVNSAFCGSFVTGTGNCNFDLLELSLGINIDTHTIREEGKVCSFHLFCFVLFFVFLKFFLDTCPLLGPLIPLFWTSSDVFPFVVLH